MSSETLAAGDGGETSAGPAPAYDKQKEKARVSKPSLILCHDAHQNDASAVWKPNRLLSCATTRTRTTHLQSGSSSRKIRLWFTPEITTTKRLGWIDVVKCLIEFGADGQNGSHFEPKPLPPPIPKKCDWEIDPAELDFSNAAMIGNGSFGEIVKAYWRGTPVAIKRILSSLSDDRLVM
uniref:Protein kinase domain-containing protein n=1 Tax=Brassica oleracea var. oleracea TaxID=109376 RepID=A0A0D3A3P5_BRAOL